MSGDVGKRPNFKKVFIGLFICMKLLYGLDCRIKIRIVAKCIFKYSFMEVI